MAGRIDSGTVPVDVRLMNGAATVLFTLFGLAVLAAALLWLSRAPWFALRAIEIEGDLQHNSVSTIRANAMPRLSGNFLSLDLEQARAAFEAVPWVRQATLRREWPDRLVVRLSEQHPVALWLAEDGNDKLVNSFGEIFEANLGDVEDLKLPQFEGPDSDSAQMLAMYRRLSPMFEQAGMQLATLHLSGRGSWRATFGNGAVIDLGRGSEEQLLARAARFFRTVGQIGARFPQRALEHVDLRYADAYALKLRGVTTADAAASSPKRKN